MSSRTELLLKDGSGGGGGLNQTGYRAGQRRRPAVVAAVAGTALDPPTWCWAPRRPHTLFCTVQALVCT